MYTCVPVYVSVCVKYIYAYFCICEIDIWHVKFLPTLSLRVWVTGFSILAIHLYISWQENNQGSTIECHGTLTTREVSRQEWSKGTVPAHPPAWLAFPGQKPQRSQLMISVLLLKSECRRLSVLHCNTLHGWLCLARDRHSINISWVPVRIIFPFTKKVIIKPRFLNTFMTGLCV